MTAPAPTPVRQSRVWKGTLTLGATPLDISCQVRSVQLVPAYSDDGEAFTTLCGDTVQAGRKMDGLTLEGTIVQDFDADEASGGVQAYLWANNLEKVAFTFLPNVTGAPTITGDVLLELPNPFLGGEAGAQLTTDFVWQASNVELTWAATAAAAEPAA